MDRPEALAAKMKKLAVEISLSNGSSLAGKIYVPVQARLTDVLNDERRFLPVECTDGSFQAVSKEAIERITLPSVEPEDCCSRDPDRTWIKLTDTQYRPIHVNMEHAVSLKRTMSERKRSTAERTAIGFIGGDHESIVVLETPEQILALLSVAKQQNIPVDGPEMTPPAFERENGAALADSNEFLAVSS